jgi:YidC/Oxa1 family membrane protein insertase
VIDKLNTQQRVILATVLSFLFFVGYDYLFIPKKDALQTSQNKVSSQQTHQSPATTQKEAPKTATVSPEKNLHEEKIISKIISPRFDIAIDSLGRIEQFTLKDPRYKTKTGEALKLFNESFLPRPLEIRFANTQINTEAFSNEYSADSTEVELNKTPKTITLTQKLQDLIVTKKITFYPAGNYIAKISLSKPQEYFISPGFRPDVIVDGYTFHGALIKEADDTLTLINDKDAKGEERFTGAKIAASSDRYYTTAFYNFDKGFDVAISKDENANPLIFVKGAQNFEIKGFIGAKEHKALQGIDPRLTDIIEYGFFTFVAKPVFLLLNYLHGIFGNWGWAIVVTTILIRLALYPLTYKGMVSMNKLKELSPKIKELQKKYKGEPQKLNAHMMELYKKHGANPMGGCLPILLQVPIFFAIYRVLQNASELQSAPWILWIEDLSLKDPYFILPLLMGATMFWHQRITPTNFTDPMQEKIMKFLPLIFTFFFVTFPAGLTLYWFVNNIFSIAQQYYVNSIFKKKKDIKA